MLNLSAYDEDRDPSYSAEDLARARAEGAATERARIAAIAGSTEAKRNPAAALVLIASARPGLGVKDIAAVAEANSAAAAASWDDIVEKINRQSGLSPRRSQ